VTVAVSKMAGIADCLEPYDSQIAVECCIAAPAGDICRDLDECDNSGRMSERSGAGRRQANRGAGRARVVCSGCGSGIVAGRFGTRSNVPVNRRPRRPRAYRIGTVPALFGAARGRPVETPCLPGSPGGRPPARPGLGVHPCRDGGHLVTSPLTPGFRRGTPGVHQLLT
jgi:hypothetical protein